MNAAEFIKSQDWYNSLGSGCSTEQEYWFKFAEAFAASETAAKEAAERELAETRTIAKTQQNLKELYLIQAEAAEAERDTLQQALKDEMVQSGQDQNELRAERDRAVRALEKLEVACRELLLAVDDRTKIAAAYRSIRAALSPVPPKGETQK